MTVPALERIDHIHVFVSDRPAAVDWYARVLGFRPVPEMKFWARDGGPLTLADASGRIHLALFERPRETCRSTIAFATTAEPFAAWYRHLSAVLGTAPVLEDHELTWSLYFSDPDGNPFEITCYECAAIAGELGSA